MSCKPTVCQLLHSLTIGGAEVLAARLARKLSGEFRFVFACLDDLGTLGSELADEGFPIEVLRRRPGVDFACMRRLARFWRTEKVDAIHAHQYTPFFYALAARHVWRRPPILFTEHGRWFPDFPRRKRMLFNRAMLRRTDRVVGVGESVRQALIHNEGIRADRVSVIYNGVERAAFEQNGICKATVRAEMGVGAEDFVILQVARLDHLKDHLTAIRTIRRVAARHENTRLILVGEGPERAMIEDEIRVLRLESHVRLLGLRKDVSRLLQGADLFLLTSISEGIPVTIIEAMAAGLPIVSTDVGGVPEIVCPEETGLLASPGDDTALAAAILGLADDPVRGQEMGRRGHRRVENAFSQQEMHARYLVLYEEMLDE